MAFAVQSGVPTAAFRNNSSRTQAFEAHQLATKTYEVCAVSISVKFARTVQVNNLERMSSYFDKMLLSEGGRVLEAACLTGTGILDNHKESSSMLKPQAVQQALSTSRLVEWMCRVFRVCSRIWQERKLESSLIPVAG